MLKQLKDNTVSVPSTLGGGVNGYLVMLVSAQAYDTVAPGTSFIPPLMPGVLVIGPNNTQYQIAIVKTQYDRAMTEYQTYILM